MWHVMHVKLKVFEGDEAPEEVFGVEEGPSSPAIGEVVGASSGLMILVGEDRLPRCKFFGVDVVVVDVLGCSVECLWEIAEPLLGYVADRFWKGVELE